MRAPKVLVLILVLVPVACLVGCDRGNAYPSRPITLVCPWAAGGGTDRVSRQMAILMEQRLGQPVTVINATGGKGVTGHSRGLNARPDGYTLTMMTFELNTMHWAGLTDLSFEDCVPLLSLNEDYAALMVRSDSKWRSIADLESEIAANVGQLTASGTALGGAWHLALAGWLVSADLEADAVTWVPSAGANPSLQQLLSGGVDMVCCSLPEARTMLESGQVRALGVMSPSRATGFEEVPTFVEQGRDWTLGGWRGLAVPLGTPDDVVDRLELELTSIVREEAVEGSFANFMDTQKFDRTWRGPDDFKEFLAANDRKLGQLLQSDAMKSVNQDRFNPLAYPFFLLAMMGFTLVGLALTRQAETSSSEPRRVIPAHAWVNAVVVIVAIGVYAQFAETLGFVGMAGCILFLLLIRFKTRIVTSAIITAVTIPAIDVVFTTLLRVPLP